MKRLFALLLVLSVSGVFAGTPDDSVLSLRELISQTNTKLLSGIVPSRNDLDRIRAILEDGAQYESYRTDGEKPADIKELSEQFSLFEELCSSSESSDTCLNVLKSFRMKFNTLFGPDI